MATARDRKLLRAAAALLERVAKSAQERTTRFAMAAEATEAIAPPAPDKCMDAARRLRAMARR